jgi:hypothetical protein
MNARIAWLAARLKEPSSHASLAAIGALIVPVLPASVQLALGCIAAGLAMLGFALPEK